MSEFYNVKINLWTLTFYKLTKVQHRFNYIAGNMYNSSIVNFIYKLIYRAP